MDNGLPEMGAYLVGRECLEYVFRRRTILQHVLFAIDQVQNRKWRLSCQRCPNEDLGTTS